MRFFTDEHEQFRATVRRYVEQEVNPHVDAWEQAGMMPLHDLFADMAKLGFLGLTYDPSFGGQGADHLFTVVLAEEFGRCDHGSLPMALGVQTDMATPSLAMSRGPTSVPSTSATTYRGGAGRQSAKRPPGRRPARSGGGVPLTRRC